ncbi:MAG: DHHA1 domain-containing protein, partial [Steroidobacteraceae bacterium]
KEIEHLVNSQIRVNAPAETQVMAFEKAVAAGAMALFGEKYGDEVSVMKFGDFSTELCGGTHVGRTGDIGFFRITGEGGIASGIRRIEAMTGEGALDVVKSADATLKRVAASLRATPAELEGKVTQLLEQQKRLEREISALRAKLATGGGATDLAAQAVKVNGVNVLAAKIEGADAQTLREAADRYKDRLGDAVVVFGAQVADDKVSLVSSISATVSVKVSAGALIGEVAKLVGGRGGGRPDFAQAGGNDPSKLDAALRAVPDLVAAKLGGT